MKTVLVTGGNGQLAKCIKDIDSNNSELKFIFKSSSEFDITNQKQVVSFFNLNKIDWCINCAAYTAVDKAEKESDLAFKINSEGVKYLAEECSLNKVKLIHISTDFVFDGFKTSPYLETDIPNPINVYGASKLQGEKHIQASLNEYFIIRTSWLYSEHGNNFVKTMLCLGKEKNEISIVNDQIGSPTYARDLAELIYKIITKNHNQYGVYHYCNSGFLSWYDFAKLIFQIKEVSCKAIPIASNQYPTLAKRPIYSVLETNKTVKTFHFDNSPVLKSLTNCLQRI